MDKITLLDEILQQHKQDIEQKEAKDKQVKEKKDKEIEKKFQEKEQKKRVFPKYCVREDGKKKWVDNTLQEWDTNDYRIFVGNLGDEITDDHLIIVFKKYPSFKKAKVIKEKVTGKNKGYGFVSFGDPQDYVRAMKEIQGKYIGKKPVMLKRSEWKKKGLKKIKIKKLKYLESQLIQKNQINLLYTDTQQIITLQQQTQVLRIKFYTKYITK